MPGDAGVASRLAKWTGSLSLAAGAIHGGVSVEHFAEWWGYGVFFVAAATCQMVLGLALLTNAVNPKDAGASWRRLWGLMVWLGIVGNLLIVGLYAVTRTTGIPFLGPDAGKVEELSGIDVVTTLLEVVTVVLLALMVRKGPGEVEAQ